MDLSVERYLLNVVECTIALVVVVVVVVRVTIEESII
jgi:hypothetical protein